MSEYRLVMKGVVKTFPGVKALDHAQLELRPGKVMALMGENGAGKSTLMKCMFGIYKMDEGEIEYEGEKVTITTPDFTFGLTNTFSYKGLNLSILIQGSYGNDIYNVSRMETEGMYDGKNQSTKVAQ